MVRAILDVFCKPQESEYGLVWSDGERKLIFYTGDGRIAGRDKKWVQDALSMTVSMFRRMGLKITL